MVSLVDGALHHLGKPGSYHLLVAALLCCNYFPITFNHMAMLFYSIDIPHNCRLPDGWPWHKKFSIPTSPSAVPGGGQYDQCRMFVDPNSAQLGTKSCVYGWEFFPSDREWTIKAEWGLVCEREYLVTLASVVYSGGVMFGGLVFGTLADKFGRKPLMLFTLYMQTAISIGVYFLQNFILYVILRFVHGFLLQGLQCTTLCLVVELLPMRYRAMAGVGCSVVWALAMIALSVVAVSVQHWRYIQLAISLPCVVTIVYIWVVPESVRWLVTMMKTENAVSTAQKFASFNKRPLDEAFPKDVESAAKHISSKGMQVENYGVRELVFQGSQLRISSLVLSFCWFSASALYQALFQSLVELASDRYSSIVVVGFIDLIAFVVMYFLLIRFGRKRPLCALLALGGAICISTVVAGNLDEANSLEVRVVFTVLALVERSCMAACLAGLSVCAAEMFPTVVRAFGIGVCLFCGQLGWSAAPHILKLGLVTMKAVPWLIFGSLGLVASFLVLLLPEMCSKALPDTLEDVECLESRKAPLRSPALGRPAVDDVSAAESLPPPPPQDYRAYIEAIIDGQDGPTEGSEKRWYHSNYSRRSERVVRFYGLDTSPHDDPCHEVKASKKIRMVRFSFENEEFRVDPWSPTRLRRFSVIAEEPELETVAEREDVAELAAVETPSRFVVQRVEEEAEASSPGSGSSRSRFTVQRVAEDVAADDATKKPRFLVQRVKEDCENLNNNNPNENNNNYDDNLIVDKKWGLERNATGQGKPESSS